MKKLNEKNQKLVKELYDESNMTGRLHSEWAYSVIENYVDGIKHAKYSMTQEDVTNCLTFLKTYLITDERSARTLFNRCEKSLGGVIDQKLEEQYRSVTDDSLDYTKCFFILDLCEAF